MTIFAPQGNIKTPVRITFRAFQDGALFDQTFADPDSTYDTGSGEVALDEQLRNVRTEKIGGGYGRALSGPPGYKANVMMDNPTHYYRLDDAIQTNGPIADLGTAGVVGTQGLVAGWTSVAGLTADSTKGFANPDTTARYLSPGTAVPFNTATPFTLEAVVQYVPLAAIGQMVWASSANADGWPFSYILRTTAGGDVTFVWAPRGNAGGGGSTVSWTGITNSQWPDGAPVHIALTWTGATKIAELFVQGVSLGTRTSTTDISSAPAFGAIFGSWYRGAHIWPMVNGSIIDEIAVYAGTVLSSARIAAHGAARAIP